jgi:hypothetical protein
MEKAMPKPVTRWLLAAMLTASGWAQAVTITDSAVTSTVTQYLISAGSTVSYAPGYFGGDATGPYSITGSFTATVSSYWWDYFLDGDPSGSKGTFRSDATTIQFTNPVISGAISPDDFQFPGFAATMTGNEFSGNDGGCSLPLGPDTYCAGFTTPGFASYSGNISGKRIALHGYAPAGLSDFSGFNYSIQAAAVPEPSVLMSLTLGLSMLGAMIRFRRHPA